MPHISVLRDEVCDFFAGARGVLVDATLGLGGHSEALLADNANLRVIGIDKDSTALALAAEKLGRFGERFAAINASFSSAIGEILGESCDVCGVLADLGVSSLQLDDKSRGFSFASENLDMRMDQNAPLDAKTLINSYTKAQLDRIFAEFGEVKNPSEATRLILEARKIKPIESGKELCEIFERGTRGRQKIHPATLIFQALRIAVNDELGELSRLLDALETHAARLRGAKIAVISFHSLEDRMAKERFKRWAKSCRCDEGALKCTCGDNHALGEVATKKPLSPSAAEIARNPRARSAKMRGFRFYA